MTNLSKQAMDMKEGGNRPANGPRAVKRTSLTADLVEMPDTKMIRPITTSHPLAEVHQIVAFLKSFCKSKLITMIVAEIWGFSWSSRGAAPFSKTDTRWSPR